MKSLLQVLNQDNMSVMLDPETADVVYGDCIYESLDFAWVVKYWQVLKPHGVFIVQTDFHSLFEYGMFLQALPGATLVNHLVWKNEWGNHPKNRFHQSFDDILIFSKEDHNRFYSDRVQVPKATAKTKLNPSGRDTKTATAFIDDICLTTTSKERVLKSDGHLVRWQKPLKLLDRILLPFTDVGDLVVDPFFGSGTTGEWCLRNNRNCLGIEIDVEVYALAWKRLENVYVSLDDA